MKEHLIFYTTIGCHLCEVAKSVCDATLNPEFFDVEEVDIAHADSLIEQYGTRIPVLYRVKDGSELNWPFTQEELMAFLPE